MAHRLHGHDDLHRRFWRSQGNRVCVQSFDALAGHDLQFGHVMERLVRQLTYDLSEFCNYLKRPSIRYNDQMFQRTLRRCKYIKVASRA